MKVKDVYQAAENLQRLCNAISFYEERVRVAQDGGHDGGDVYEAEEAWKQVLALASEFNNSEN